MVDCSLTPERLRAKQKKYRDTHVGMFIYARTHTHTHTHTHTRTHILRVCQPLVFGKNLSLNFCQKTRILFLDSCAFSGENVATNKINAGNDCCTHQLSNGTIFMCSVSVHSEIAVFD